MPSNSYQFTLTNLALPNFTLNVISCTVDMVQKQLQVKIRQPLDAGITMREIQSLCQTFNELSLNLIDGNGKVDSSTIYRAKAIKHNITYDYCSTEIATHSMILKYKP